jgi:hypothetical protein
MGINYNPRTVTDGLVLALDAANRKSYPTTGTTWTDLSGRGNNGTLTNGPTYSSANGGSIVFDGVNDYVDLGTATSLGFSAVRTISCWTKITVIGGHILSMWDLVGGVDQRTFIIAPDSGSSKFISLWSPDGGSDGTILYDTSTISLNTWYNLTIIYRSGVRELWVNGALVSSLSQATIYTSASTNRLGLGAAIGRSSDTPIAFLNGNTAQVSLYNRALTATEITQNYNALKGRFSI